MLTSQSEWTARVGQQPIVFEQTIFDMNLDQMQFTFDGTQSIINFATI